MEKDHHNRCLRQTMGILLTLGAIGKGVAKRAQGFGMVGSGLRCILERGIRQSERHIIYATPEEIYQSCDFITLHLPLTPETKNMIGYEQFCMMKLTPALLSNTRRGGVVDEDALVRALKEGKNLRRRRRCISFFEPPANEELLHARQPDHGISLRSFYHWCCGSHGQNGRSKSAQEPRKSITFSGRFTGQPEPVVFPVFSKQTAGLAGGLNKP